MTLNNITLTSLVRHLNQSKRKKSGKKFTIGDAQGYVRRGHLPKYLGGGEIDGSDLADGVKLYNVKK